MGKESCLVCVIAETRSHELTYESFEQKVLDELDADLALCISDRFTKDDPFIKKAKYIWTYPEVEDWATAYDEMARIYESREPWRECLKVKDQFLGGIKDNGDEHPGSAGILIFFRWWLLKNLKESGVIDMYDRFIVTRSDYVYACPHPPLELLSSDHIWIPDGEQYGGVTDRHIVVPKMHLESVLNIADDIIIRPLEFRKEMQHKSDWNLEQIISNHMVKKKIRDKVAFFPFVMYTVRHPRYTSRWNWGTFDKDAGVIIKYREEFKSANFLKDKIKNKNDWKAYIHPVVS